MTASNLIKFSNYFNKKFRCLTLPHNVDSLKGFLLGLRAGSENTVIVNSAHSVRSDWKDLTDEYSKLQCCLPVGIDIVGYFVVASESSVPLLLDELSEYMLSLDNDTEVWPPRNLLLSLTTEGQLQLWKVVDKARVAVTCDVEDVNISQSYILCHLKTVLPLNFEYHADEEKFYEELTESVNLLKQSVTGNTIALRVDGANILILPEKNGGVDDENVTWPEYIFSHSRLLCGQLVEQLVTENSSERTKLRRTGDFSKERIHLKLLLASCEADTPAASPIIHHTHKALQCVRMSLPVDIIGHIALSTSLGDVRAWFLERLQTQLEACLESILKHSENHQVLLPKPFHFWPSELPHAVTVIYPCSKSDDELEDSRRELHGTFLLPTNRPVFRRSNALTLGSKQTTDNYLVNPHLALPDITGEQVHLVQGSYVYHHYMQNHFDDNGWGCAYRSLQTIVSWFRCQGYSGKPVPVHRDIQQILVSIGDKPANFVGSRQWIGSTEVSYVLDTYLGVTSRILHVSLGSEMVSKTRELMYHFDTQGTPIMIGGGMYAHTILGVNYNEQTGQVKYLILDPHYTGADVVKEAVSRGGISWKTPDFWDKTVFYNMCLPQRPSII